MTHPIITELSQTNCLLFLAGYNKQVYTRVVRCNTMIHNFPLNPDWPEFATCLHEKDKRGLFELLYAHLTFKTGDVSSAKGFVRSSVI